MSDRRKMSAVRVLVGVAAALGAMAGPALGQGSGSPEPDVAQAITQARSLSKAFQHVAKTMGPAVVHVNTLAPVRGRGMFGMMPLGNGELRQYGMGSGVIVSPDGYILTNNHVVEDAAGVRVRISDGREMDAQIVGRDPATDLAVLRVDAENLPYAEFANSDLLEVGEWVVAIGNPYGFDNTVTAGIVSAMGRALSESPERYEEYIQTDAAINPGNSGGPLFNLDGKIVGINTAIASRTGGSVGIGFAIPSTIAEPVMETLIRDGRVERGWVGIEMATALPTSGVAGMPSRLRGVAIRNVVEGSPADKAGLRPGDVVVKFRGREIDGVQRLRNSIALTPPGTEATVEVIRDGQPVTLRVNVGDMTTMRAEAMGGEWVERLGMAVMTLEPAMLPGRLRDLEGVVVIEVDEEGAAAEAGFEVGDLVTQVGRTPTPTAEAFERAVDGLPARGTVRFQVLRQGTRGFMRGYIDVPLGG